MALLDTTNIELLRSLRDGRKPYSEIAHELGVSENTVRARVSRLQDDGVLSFSGLVDPERIDGAQMVYIGVKLDAMNHREIAERLSRLTSVVSTAVVTGRYDIIVTALLTDGYGLLEFYSDEISHIDGIRSVETFVVYRGYNLHVPMITGRKE
jgi:Lrp/AsnC family transcriptional regulator for asnA, asnC and gidA